MKILIVKLSAIGDVIHTLPALNAIRSHYPQAHITWLVEEAAYHIIKDHPALDRVILSKRKTWIKDKQFSQIISFIRTLRDTQYDLIIDFQALLKSGILIFLAKGKIKAGFDKGMQHDELSYIFLNKKIKPVSMEIHALQRYLILIKNLGIQCSKIEYNLPITQKDNALAHQLLAEHRLNNSKYLIAINPVAKWETKLWDQDKFALLADKLIQQKKAAIFFTGSAADKPVIKSIIQKMKNTAADFSGKTTLTILAALYKKADILITTDTGPMHLCAAVGTPATALFGPTSPNRTGPYGKIHTIITKNLKCSTCFKRNCPLTPKKQCMNQITVQDLFEKINLT